MQPLIEYIQEKRGKGFSDNYIKQLASGKGYTQKEVDRHFPEAKPKKSKALIVFAIIGVLIIIIPTIFYLTIVSPTFVVKPIIEMPTSQEISTDHVSYFINELNGYKLHSDPRNSDPAVIEFVLTDLDESYSVIIENGKPLTSIGSASNADLRIKLNSDNLQILLSSENMNSELVTMVNNGDVQIETISDEVTLGLKGYKALYNAATKDSGSPTGGVISEFRSNIFN